MFVPSLVALDSAQLAVPVQNRIGKLEANGTIVGYTVRLKPSAGASRIRAIMCITVNSNREADVVRTLRGVPTVCALHSTNGRWDLIAELQSESLEAFDKALNAIRQIEGIGSTETGLLLSTYKL